VFLPSLLTKVESYERKNPQPLVGDRGQGESSTSYCSESNRAVAHAAGGSKGREEGRERGYYYLHRNLNQALFFHGFG
jgi:hypothetical protein